MTVLDSFRLDDKVAVVTGGNRGIGMALARALGEAGARVAIAARDAARSEAVAGELGALAVDDRRHRRRERRRPCSRRSRPSSGPSTCSSTTPAPASTARPSRCRRRSGARCGTSTSTACGAAPASVGRQMVERGTGVDRQRRLDLGPDRQPAAVAAGLQRLQGGGPPAHQVAGRRVGAARRPRQRARARATSRPRWRRSTTRSSSRAGSTTRRCSATRCPRSSGRRSSTWPATRRRS